jgi:hypothetical protein
MENNTFEKSAKIIAAAPIMFKAIDEFTEAIQNTDIFNKEEFKAWQKLLGAWELAGGSDDEAD